MLQFLYHTAPGRILLKVLTWPPLSRACGRFLDSPWSKFLIAPFIEKNGIDMTEYQVEQYNCFNDCFCRKIRPEMRPIDEDPEHLIAPCDGLLSAYEIQDDLVIPVKGSQYRISDLLQSEHLAKRFSGGLCLVYRLCVTHYHRYCYPDSGMKGKNVFIPGVLHTVQPIALRCEPVFSENAREYTLLHSDHFGHLIQMEVGAMLVGKIKNKHGMGRVQRGQEKGCFLYGGSTVIVLVEPGKARITPKALAATAQGREIPVKMGQMICKK